MKSRIDPDYEFEACCLACGEVTALHKNVHWGTCSNPKCRVAIKVKHEASREDLRQVEWAICQLKAGNYKVL